MSGAASNTVAPSKRKRSRRACDPCRKRKKKCDGKEPCQLCQDYEYDCSYVSEEAPGGLPPWKHSNQASTASTLPTTHGRQSLPRNAGGGEDRTVFDSRKGFLVDASSVLAFPRLLANSLESGQPPKLRDLVYNIGLRQERYFVQGNTLRDILSLENAQRYAQVFFRVVHPWHTYLDPEEFMARLQRHFSEMLHEPPFEMLTSFIVALGSYFGWPDRFGQEDELVEFATSLMDRCVFPDVSAEVCIYYAGAWVARSIYQRATASPRSAWMASCMSMHVVEFMGLHKEWDTMTNVAPQTTEALSPALLDGRRRMYWTAFTVNRLVSTEYGRSCVDIAGTNCKPVDWKPGETFQLLVDTARSLPHVVDVNEESKIESYVTAVQELAKAPKANDPVYIALVRGDVACLLYRRLSLMNVRLSDDTAKQILSLGQKGTEAACTLAVERLPWWKVISTPFQFLCVLLSVDTPESLKLIPQALRTLLQVNEVFGTQRTKESYETAQLLVQIAQQKKEKELNYLKEGLSITSSDLSMVMSEAWADMDIDWMELMDPDLFSIDMIV